MSPSRPERSAVPTSAEAALIDTVLVLRDEIQGLRAAAQFRAVIEQAKGVLVERHHISLEEAFDRLRSMSQEHNVRLVEVAATVVGVTLPEQAGASASGLSDDLLRGRMAVSPVPSTTWRALADQPDVRAGVLSAVIHSVAGQVVEGDEAAQLLVDLLASQGVVGVILYRTAEDGSLRLVGQCGVPADVISPWRSIPPSRDIPYVRSREEDSVFFWGDRAARIAQFPATATTTRATSIFEAAAVIPIREGESVVGVAGLMWTTTEAFDEARATQITATVRGVAHVLLRNANAADPEREWLTTLLELQLDPWLLLETIPSTDGSAREFLLQGASWQVPEAGQWIGRSLHEVWPGIAFDGIGAGLSDLARAGGSWATTVHEASDTPWGTPGNHVRAARLGRRVVLVWRPVGPESATLTSVPGTLTRP